MSPTKEYEKYRQKLRVLNFGEAYFPHNIRRRPRFELTDFLADIN